MDCLYVKGEGQSHYQNVKGEGKSHYQNVKGDGKSHYQYVKGEGKSQYQNDHVLRKAYTYKRPPTHLPPPLPSHPQLEPRIRRKRFNQLGGIQFDADVRSLAAFFIARASRRIRERFTRLLQIAQLLNLESPAEVLEYWGPGAAVISGPAGGGGVQWELSAEEVRAVLGLRVDFSAAEVARLRL